MKAPAPGTIISHYRILQRLGAGGMGEVYLAEDTQLDRKVAIKFLPPESLSDEPAKKRLVREARAAAKLDHPNICSVYEVAEEDSRRFIVMQYVEGETLASRIQRKPLELKEVLEVAAQIADALAEAHSHGIIHRDIKPANIMLTARHQAKVMDFGLAKVVRERSLTDTTAETESLLTEPGAIIGTVPYMSPEQVRGESLDARSDIFSFGAVLYEMLSGRQPFSAESAAATISALLIRDPPPLARYSREVPAEMERIVAKALRKNREERYQTAKDLFIDLKTLRQRLEFQAELGRSQSPDSRGGAAETTFERPETKYARSGEVNIAYQVAGSGPLDLVYVMGWVSNLDYFWEDPSYARFLNRLASFSRLILFDKRGTGLSDRVHESELPTLEQRMDDVRAVMDAVGSDKAALFGVSEGGPMCALFAATYPERTAGLVIYGSYAKRIWSPDYPWAPTPQERQKWYDLLQQGWGGVVDLATLAPSVAADERFKEWWAAYLRQSASPGAALALARMNTQIDIAHVLPAIRVPTLILHRVGDLDADVGGGRYLAEQIHGAKYIELPGNDHLPWVGNQDAILDQAQQFLTRIRHAPELDRVLATVLVARVSARPGSRQWQDLFRSELERFRGCEIEATSNRLSAHFDGPARAIRAACAISDSARGLGIEIRAGLHTGECDVIGGKLGGVAVEISAQVAANASEEILVSSTVKDLVAGSGIQFEDRGTQVLEGVEGEWRLFAVKRESDSGEVKKAERKSQAKTGARSKAIDSLAILPLANASADPNMEYLSDGITESIISSLSQLPKLKVMSRSTVFRYKGQEVSLQQVGRDLNVRAIVSGRVLQLGDNLVLGVELVSVADGSQLWGEQYKRKLSDVFAMQEEIAREISGKLRLRLTRAQKKRLTKRHTENAEAYQLYLKGRYFWNQRSVEGLHKGIAYFDQAIRTDPAYALAYTGLADCYTKLGDVGVTAMTPREAFARAHAAAIRALEIDSSLAEAHASLGHLDMHHFRWADAEKDFKSAIELNPNYATAHHWYAYYMVFNSRFDEALEKIETAGKLDPLSLAIADSVGEFLYFARRQDEAIEQFEKTLEMDPDFLATRINLGHAYEQKGMFKEAEQQFIRARQIAGESIDGLASLGHTYALSGKTGAALEVLAQLAHLSKQTYVSPYDIAIIHAGLGDLDEAFSWLDRAYREGVEWMIFTYVDPRLDPLRSDPRFTDLITRLGFAGPSNR
ncbi:MAG: alpha/beta fold hydrolase [Blastocatellia bacterium]